ncbi:MAG: helix-turn-helix domain-containing protein [Gemmatimonadetes bacterium]|nr:helix-turn-helix domain-containing protein [Gemmatimonadota bacterium]
MDTKVPRLLRVREAAGLTGLQPWRIYEMIKRGEGPPHLRVRRTIFIPEDGLVRWIEERSATHHGEV